MELQWRLRREDEGGPELVAAWAEIIHDFRLALPKATKPLPKTE